MTLSNTGLLAVTLSVAVAAGVYLSGLPGKRAAETERAGGSSGNSSSSTATLQASGSVSGVHEEALLARLTTLEDTIDELQRTLQLEQTSRLALQSELSELQIALESLIAADPLQTEPATAGSAGQSGETDLAGGDRFLSAGAPGSGQRAVRLSQEQALIAAGVDNDTARELRDSLDQYALAELEIRDTAAREGWLDSADYRQRRDALLPDPVNLRQLIGDQAWDTYLIAGGGDNRVRIESVINGSAAFVAGIEVGDLVLAYAGQRVYSMRELQRFTRAGERGEIVSIQLGRGDAVFDTTIARGPLGVTLSSVRQQPASGEVGQ